MVEPVHIFEGGVLDLVTVFPRRPLVDKFGLVQADDGLGEGVDAPIVKYCGSGGAGRALPGTVVGHDSLVDLAGEEPFEAADDVFFGEAFGGAASDVVDGGLVESHSYDGDSVECRVGLSVSASVEAVPAGLS